MVKASRRGFLRSAGLTWAAGRFSRVLGANERVHVAVIGVGGRGRSQLREYASIKNCRITGVCDVDQASLERAVALAQTLTGEKPRAYIDMRDAFADKEIDAVSMPLPNHWHALATIWACQAGKDVYVEKPACHNIFEGIKMVEAARKYQRMVQVGSQSRSVAHKQRAIQLLRQGVIGDIYLSKGLCFKRRKSIGHKPDGPVPPGVAWDNFLGPAPMRPFNELRFHYNWHWFWDTGNGDIGNQGVHEMDVARWGLNANGFPTSVVSTGGKFTYDDDQETPNTQLATFDYEGRQLVFEVRGLPTGGEGDFKNRGGNYIGNLFYGTEGWMAVDGDGFRVYKGESQEKIMEESGSDGGAAVHMENFFQAVRSRNYKDLNADIEIGVTSAALCHLANISYRTGRKLAFDPASMNFGNDEQANRMLSREYRRPYVVPDKV
jgi:predicted dehydrogenase